MPSSTRPSAIAKRKAAAAPCPMLPRPVDVQAAMGLSDTTVDGLMDTASSASDTLAWCPRPCCARKRSVRTDSFFAKSKLPLRKLVRLICHWAARTAVIKAAEIVGVK
ncbi:hypothetical protein GN244_ATG08501 [Phytophthora infestans]|uniref:Uncharacterized protein n=1 Tax=Phytophthora infestans TaxID=4787 RepID=A0A833WEU0_PHYIN|nr:hypothetical protein GN244_ATG08501 [Phytophthora infestans]